MTHHARMGANVAIIINTIWSLIPPARCHTHCSTIDIEERIHAYGYYGEGSTQYQIKILCRQVIYVYPIGSQCYPSMQQKPIDTDVF